MVAPVLPWLTDSAEALDRLLAALAGAGASGVTVLALHLRPGAREWYFGWLRRHRPDLVPRYRRLYGSGAYVPREYRAELRERVDPLLRRHGFGRAGTRRVEEPAPMDVPAPAARPQAGPLPVPTLF